MKGYFMSESKTPPVLYIMLTLIVVNLCFSGLILLREGGERSINISTPLQTLPSDLKTNEAKLSLFKKIQKAYNTEQNEVLLNMLDPAAKELITAETFAKQISTARMLAGKIQSGAYSHYEFTAVINGLKTFKIVYNVTLEKGKGKVKIVVAAKGDEPHRIQSFYIERH